MLSVGITLPSADLAGEARFVEELGFESVWLPDLQFGDGSPGLEAVTALGLLAGVTERVGLGLGTLVLPVRQVAWLGTQLLTLQHLSGERVLLGVGTGGFPGAPFWSAVGAPAAGRGRRADEALLALPALLAGHRVEVNGAKISFGPPARMPPVLVGGNSDAAVQRTVRFGDDWFPSLIGPESLGRRVGELRARAAEAGRTAPGVTIGGHMFVSESPDAFARNLVEVYGMSEEDAATAPMPGDSPQAIIDRFGAYADAGAHRVVVAVDTTGTAWRRDIEAIAAAIRG